MKWIIRGIFAMIFVGVILTGCGGGISTLAEVSDYDQRILDGWRQYNLNNFETAQSIFFEAQGIDAERSEGYIGAGWSLFMRQKPDSALVQFNRGEDFITSLNDTLDTVCGVSGCYLARGYNSKVISYLSQYDLAYFEDVFPLEDHDFFLDRGDLELVYAQAYYLLGYYSSTESADPANAVYHLNQVLPVAYTYVDAEDLMNEMVEYMAQSEGLF